MNLIIIVKICNKIRYVINDQDNTEYDEGNENDSIIQFETKVLCDYTNACILVTGDITAIGHDVNTWEVKVVFKNCAPFKCNSYKYGHIDTAENLEIIMPIYNLIEYNDNYSDTSESLWQFERDESPVTNAGNPDNVSLDNSLSFKYISSFLKH